MLCDQRSWDDRGTGHVACLQSPDNSNAWCIIVRLEANGSKVIAIFFVKIQFWLKEKNVLESKIQLDTVYQKQQGTLIVWSESDICDLALSFQEKSGCTELWEKICRIQGKDPENDAVGGKIHFAMNFLLNFQDENECEENEPSDSRLVNEISKVLVYICI